MRIQIKRVDPTLPLPQYQTPGAVAFDIYSRIDATLAPGEMIRLPTNLIIAVPPGYMLLLAARSSLGPKKGLTKVNGVGIIDQDFCGENDEIQLSICNSSREPIRVARGERLGQGVLVPIEKAEWEETDVSSAPTRGGFGTTG